MCIRDSLSSELSIDEKTIRSKVDKVTSIEKIKNNVSKKTGDKILSYGLAGVKVEMCIRDRL